MAMQAKLTGTRLPSEINGERPIRRIREDRASCYDRDVAISPDLDLSRADVFSQSGLELLACGEAVRAAEAFRAAIAADAAHVEAHHGLIRSLRDAEQFEAAVDAARVLTALTPEDPLALTSLSIALQKAGQIPEAESAAGRARILEWKQQLAEPVPSGEDSLG